MHSYPIDEYILADSTLFEEIHRKRPGIYTVQRLHTPKQVPT